MIKKSITKIARELGNFGRKKQYGIKERDILLKVRDELNEVIKEFNSARICDGCGLLSDNDTTKVRKEDLTLGLCNKCGLLFFQGKLKISKKKLNKAANRETDAHPKKNRPTPEQNTLFDHSPAPEPAPRPAKAKAEPEKKTKAAADDAGAGDAVPSDRRFEEVSRKTGIGIMVLKAMAREIENLTMSLQDDELADYLRSELKDKLGESRLKGLDADLLTRAIKMLKG